MCFSATLPPKIEQVLSNVLHQDYTSVSTLDATEPPTLAKVPQFSVVMPDVKDTFTVLLSLLTEEINNTDEEPKIIVFGATGKLVALYAEVFRNLTNLEVFELQSRLTQPARIKATDAFKAAKNGIMFATDGRSHLSF